MLPPGASGGGSSPSVDELLPPGAGPESLETKKQGGKVGRKRETVTFATNDGGHVTLEEPVKKVGNRELVSLTPEEKATRRLVSNLIVFGVCAVVLVASLALLLWINGGLGD